MAPMTTSRMSLQLLMQTPEFQRLSVKGRMFVSSFVGTYESFGAPDAVFAMQSAYQNKGEHAAENARKMSYNVLKSKKVDACLQVWRDSEKSKREAFIEDLERQMKATREGSAKHGRLVQLYGQIAFGAEIPETRKLFNQKSKGKSNGRKSK